MNKSDAEIFMTEIKSRGRSCHTDRATKNLNGFILVLPPTSTGGEKYLTTVEEAARFVADLPPAPKKHLTSPPDLAVVEGEDKS